MKRKIAILGGGNIGTAVGRGFLLRSEGSELDLTVTCRRESKKLELQKIGLTVSMDNSEAVKNAEVIIPAVTPAQINSLLEEIKDVIDPDKHIIVSAVSGIKCSSIKEIIGKNVPVIRIMPNIAAAIGESMTCISHENETSENIKDIEYIFNFIGTTAVIDEELMEPATALCACGTAFFLRAIRAASQGGTEIGFHPEQAIPMAAQVAKGAAALILSSNNHPETEIDKVTTPRGSTIAGLNEMEHRGFGSALIKGIVTSAEKTGTLYNGN